MIWWIVFVVTAGVCLALDLGIFHRKPREILMKEAILWSVAWTLVGLLFNLALLFWIGGKFALTWFTGYLIERALSLDNIFVFVVIFRYFGVPKKHHHPVLYWGILGAIVFRGIFIYSGVELVRRFEWTLYFLGAILIYSGIKMGLEKEKEIHPERNPVIRWLTAHFPVVADRDSGKFFVRLNGKLAPTSLFVTLVFVELTDIVFAVDSIPAILAITQDAFIIYSSNIFAILGLRALYFALAALMDLFVYLKIGLSAILVFVGVKMMVRHYVEIPIGLSLCIVVVSLSLSIAASIAKTYLDVRRARSPTAH